MDREKLAELLSVPELVKHLSDVDELILAESDRAPAFKDAVAELMAGGGKRLRPALLICTAAAGGRPADKRVIRAAAAVEMIHQASRVHDDIIDADTRPADISRAILTGDFLVSAGLGMASKVSGQTAIVLASAVSRMAQGQAVQLMAGYKSSPDDIIYNDVVSKKTGSLFRAACGIGSELGGLDNGSRQAAGRFGEYFGAAFQIADDITDGDIGPAAAPAAGSAASKFCTMAADSLKKLPEGEIKRALRDFPAAYLRFALL